jgi:hypothetical protein
MSEINWGAILVSVLASILIGSIWYGPLFGQKFRVAMGMDTWSPEKQAEMKKTMGMSYALQFVASLVMFYVLARFIGGLEQMSVQGGIMTALWVWVGFVLPLEFGNTLWGGNKTLFKINTGNMLVTLIAVGAIIGAM